MATTLLSHEASIYKDDFFCRFPKYNGLDYIKLYGYSLDILDIGKPSSAVSALQNATSGASSLVSNKLKSQVSTVPFSFPINPQSITINVPAATTLTTTMRGIVEENNGAPLRYITISGTTGILPTNGSSIVSNNKSAVDSNLSYLFKNSINSINSIKNTATRISNIFTGNKSNPLNYPTSYIDGINGMNAIVAKSELVTAYGFIHTLIRHLDEYLAVKKTKDGRTRQLRLNCYKDQFYYACTLTSYSISKIAGSLEYQYTINLTAWKRFDSTTNKRRAITPSLRNGSDQAFLAKALDATRQARKIVGGAYNTLSGFRTDIKNMFQMVGEVINTTSAAIGFVNYTLSDFGGILKNDLQTVFKQSIEDPTKGLINNASALHKIISQLFMPSIDKTNNIKTARDSQIIANAINQLDPNRPKDIGSTDSSPSMPTGGFPVQLTDWNNTDAHPEIYDSLLLSDMVIAPEAQTKIDNEQERLRNLTANDFRKKRDMVRDMVRSIAENLGLGNAVYNETYGLQAPKIVYRNTTTDDIYLLNNLNNLLMGFDAIIEYLDSIENTNVNNSYFEFYSDMAKSSNITFEDSSSKFYVPFPSDASLQSLAVQYLGDVNRWIEIAAVNGLREPYIDEDGFFVDVHGISGDKITIPTNINLYVGQVVEITSDIAFIPKNIKITEIKLLEPPITSLISYTGSINLPDYLLSSHPKIKAYMPNTVNSKRMIAIPSNNVVNIPDRIKLTPQMSDLDQINQMAYTDFMIQSNGDLALTSSGDVKLSFGFNNLVQAANLKLLTKVNSLLQDPSYGAGVEAGTPSSEINSQDILQALNESFNDDPRFTGIQVGTVAMIGPVLKINILVGVNGIDIFLPISTQLPI